MHEGYSKEKANHKMKIASRSLNLTLKKVTANTQNLGMK